MHQPPILSPQRAELCIQSFIGWSEHFWGYKSTYTKLQWTIQERAEQINKGFLQKNMEFRQKWAKSFYLDYLYWTDRSLTELAKALWVNDKGFDRGFTTPERSLNALKGTSVILSHNQRNLLTSLSYYHLRGRGKDFRNFLTNLTTLEYGTSLLQEAQDLRHLIIYKLGYTQEEARNFHQILRKQLKLDKMLV